MQTVQDAARTGRREIPRHSIWTQESGHNVILVLDCFCFILFLHLRHRLMETFLLLDLESAFHASDRARTVAYQSE